MADLKLPKFTNEAEEAEWWFDHREELGAMMVAAVREGRNGIGSLGRAKKRREEAEAAARQEQPATTR